MEVKRICAAYWSATGNTDKTVNTIAETLAEKLGVPLERRNFTRPSDRAEDLSFTGGDLVVFGMPTYAGKLPNKMLPYVQQQIHGNGALAVGVVTFGNRSYDNSLAELCAALEADGFHTVAGGAFACRHAFTDALADGRPDWDDKRQMGEFAARIADKVKDLTDIPAPVAVRRCGGALLRAQGHGRPARQVPEGQAPDGFGQVYRLRRLRPPVSHGGHQSLQRGGGARHLHQVPAVRPQVHEARQVL